MLVLSRHRDESIMIGPFASPFDYGKSPRAGRKVGHLGLVAPSRDALAGPLADAERLARRAGWPER